MIVQPDISTHWKTRHLAVLLGGGEVGHLRAVTYLVRLWAHCQQSRRDRFPESAAMLAGVCDSPMPPGELLGAMVAAGFVDLDDGEMIVHGWAELNAGLYASWGNGAKGGRPRKTQVEKKPMGNPWPPPQVTHGVTDKSREEKSRADETREEIHTPSIPAGEHTESAPKPKQPRHSALESQAEEIYQAYPRKAGKAVALKSIAKAIQTGQDPAALLATVQTFAKATKGADPQYIPHPATWFNQGRWDDDPAEWAIMGRSLPQAASKLAAGQVFHQKTHQVQLGPGTDGYEDIPL